MAEYIESKTLLNALKEERKKGNFVFTSKWIKEIVDNLPTADVVPKSEVEEISEKYEDLKLKYADLQKGKDELIAWGNDKKTRVELDFTEEEIMRSLREAGIEVSDKSISEIKAEVAREIFAEIQKIFVNRILHNESQYFEGVLDNITKDLDELKKKYTVKEKEASCSEN